jgi:hypothetical protein
MASDKKEETHKAEVEKRLAWYENDLTHHEKEMREHCNKEINACFDRLSITYDVYKRINEKNYDINHRHTKDARQRYESNNEECYALIKKCKEHYVYREYQNM